jgi:PAS domain S-box-containing protein
MKLSPTENHDGWTNHEAQLIVDTAPTLIHSGRADGYLDFFNRRWLEYLGVRLEEVQGWRWTNVIHPDDVDGLVAQWRTSLRTGKPFEGEARVRRADGQYHWFLHLKVPLRNEQGNVIRWYGSSVDIDDRKRGEGKLRAAFQEIKTLKDQLQRENIALREEIGETSMFEEIVGASPLLRDVLARVAKVAPTDSTVLITGETGTGKELIARAIHKRSQRSDRPFVKVSCSAIPQSLIASELFGHEKGAFTGALHQRIGRFELAEGGTIFLDEIGELPAETQVALLRILQEREIERVGGARPIPVDVRIIVATNRDLKTAIAVGDFRSDLFYRINVFPIEMPPLRDRNEDIPMLVKYFIDRFARKAGKQIVSVSNKTLELLQSYPWPGNIRELQNVIERSIIVCDTENFSVDESWLSAETPSPNCASSALFERVSAEERAVIEGALSQARGRVSGPQGAATKLGVPPSTLESRIKALKIDKRKFK